MKNKINSKYFYAFDKVELYDDTITFVVPNYNLMLETIITFLNNVFSHTMEFTFQDIGAGTGNESIPILNSFPYSKLVAHDLSEQMKKEFLRKSSKHKINSSRYSYCVNDYLETNSDVELFDFTISAYCIHHYPIEIKYQFFKRIFNSLKEEGYFILLDYSNFYANEISDFAHQYDIEFIKNNFESSYPFKNIDEKTKIKLKDDWLYHIENENILSTTNIQMKLMKDVGFSYVECVFKFLQHSIIIAKK